MATRDYSLGKGKVLFRKSGTQGYLDLGNAPAFAVNVTIDKLDHYSSRSGLSRKDLEVITRMGMGGSFTLDEPNGPNLAMFLMSDAGAEASAQTGGSTAADSITTIVLDRWYPMSVTLSGSKSNSAVTADANNIGTAVGTLTGTQTANVSASYTVRCSLEGASGAAEVQTRLGSGSWSAAIVVTDATPFNVLNVAADTGLDFAIDACANLKKGDEFTFAVTYAVASAGRLTNLTSATVAGKTEGSDFVLDKAAGMFMALSTGTIVAGTTVTFATTVYAANSGRTTTKGATLTSLKGDLYFVGDPPQGRIIDIQGFCSLTPNGDWALIGEDWMAVQFTVEFLEVAGQSELITVTDRGKAGTL